MNITAAKVLNNALRGVVREYEAASKERDRLAKEHERAVERAREIQDKGSEIYRALGTWIDPALKATIQELMAK